ncbi:MAG: arsenate reductase ArsC [Planctomycetaceae bacterium]
MTTSYDPSRGRVRLLFVCIENSNRSQMAEALARMMGGPGVEAHSAGSRPSGKVNSQAIASMAEIGYDLATHQSKSVDDLPPGPYDAIVTMGCGDACPSLPARLRLAWQISDPKGLPAEEFRKVREEIAERVRELLGRVGGSARG